MTRCSPPVPQAGAVGAVPGPGDDDDEDELPIGDPPEEDDVDYDDEDDDDDEEPLQASVPPRRSVMGIPSPAQSFAP